MEEFITKQVKEIYLERRKKDLEALRKDLNSKVNTEFKRIGHQLKGNASTFGYMDLEKIAKDLELVGESIDWEHAKSLVDHFERWLIKETEQLSKLS